jgi:hypothetical protein
LQKTLATELTKNNIANPESLLHSRFQVTLIEESQFPEVVLYGLAIYRSKDGKVRCLQYLPREVGTMNINIPVGVGTVGGQLVARSRTFMNGFTQK